jgi:hypothetical protein
MSMVSDVTALKAGGGLLIGEEYEYFGNKIWDLKVNTEHIKQCLPDDELTIEVWDQG